MLLANVLPDGMRFSFLFGYLRLRVDYNPTNTDAAPNI